MEQRRRAEGRRSRQLRNRYRRAQRTAARREHQVNLIRAIFEWPIDEPGLGLIEQRVDVSDRRQAPVGLSAKGVAFVGKLAAALSGEVREGGGVMGELQPSLNSNQEGLTSPLRSKGF
jgi:hypothetical protein